MVYGKTTSLARLPGRQSKKRCRRYHGNENPFARLKDPARYDGEYIAPSWTWAGKGEIDYSDALGLMLKIENANLELAKKDRRKVRFVDAEIKHEGPDDTGALISASLVIAERCRRIPFVVEGRSNMSAI